jgi:hypothetical protein
MLTVKAIISIYKKEDLVTVITPLKTWAAIQLTNNNNSLAEYRYSTFITIAHIKLENLSRKGVDSSINTNSVITEFIVAVYTP